MEYKNLLEQIISHGFGESTQSNHHTTSESSSKNIGIALSSGIDSNHILFGLIESGLGASTIAFSFHVEGILSSDFKAAQINSKALGIEFVEVVIPKTLDITRLIKIQRLGLKNKSAVESTYPMSFVWDKMREYGITTGFSGVGMDNYFGLTKKDNIYNKTLESAQKRRMELIGNGVPGIQGQVWINLANENGINLICPAYNKDVFDYFNDRTFKELNTPKEKNELWTAYPSYTEKLKLGKHTNLNCGDSGVREMYETLLTNKVLNPNSKTQMLAFWKDWQNRLKVNTVLSRFIDE